MHAAAVCVSRLHVSLGPPRRISCRHRAVLPSPPPPPPGAVRQNRKTSRPNPPKGCLPACPARLDDHDTTTRSHAAATRAEAERYVQPDARARWHTQLLQPLDRSMDHTWRSRRRGRVYVRRGAGGRHVGGKQFSCDGRRRWRCRTGRTPAGQTAALCAVRARMHGALVRRAVAVCAPRCLQLALPLIAPRRPLHWLPSYWSN